MEEPMVKSVAYFADSGEVRTAVLRSDEIRRLTLEACYAILGYRELPLQEKNRIYAREKARIEYEQQALLKKR